MKKLLTLFLILISSLVLSSCRTKATTSYQSLIDSTFIESMYSNIEKNYVLKTYVEKVRESVIDSMRRVALPVEQSTAVVPTTHHSYLSTSLAKSEVWIDSIGYLNHTLINKDSASLPYRTITTKTEIQKQDSSYTDKYKEAFYKGVKYKQSTTNVSTTSSNKKFLENFFYYSGLFAYVLIIIYTVFKLRSNGILASVFSALKKVFTGIISIFKK